MQKLRPVEILEVLQRRYQGLEIVPVNRANVVEAKLFKHGGGRQHTLGMLFKALGKLTHRGWQY